MKQSEALEIIGMVDSMNRGRDSFAPVLIQDGKLVNLGPLWAEELAELEAGIVMEAVIAIYTASTSFEKPKPVVTRDVMDMVKKIELDRRSSIPALPEADFERKTPRWVRGKLLALARGDGRVWMEQKNGYDILQRSYPQHRTYIWSEQELMEQEQCDRYIEEALKLTANEFESVYDEVFGNKERDDES